MSTAISVKPDLEAAVALLAAAQLPTQDLTERHCEHFFFAGTRASPSGLVGLELYGDVALLRSLVVADSCRNTGDGTRLLSHAEAHARAHGVRALYLLTTTAESFFARRGYARAERTTAPPAIRATREFSGICPSSSAFMSKQLS
ncbi:MAG TPA: arsenic resistance N-acetyltransferase ArsN2 [Steroidobacteraceae bacterium]|nr:arsenic resistance N-acetyltransferase ArsN2 [Steroidobacteraceae bacterium]